MLKTRILESLASYTGGANPHGQLDQCVVDRCKMLCNKQDLKAQDVKELLDDCVYGSLCTDFVIALLNEQWNLLQKAETKLE